MPGGIEIPLGRSRMERVFFNLITNALEAMPHGRKIRIGLRMAENCVLTYVEDTRPEFRVGFAIGCSNRSLPKARTTAWDCWRSPARLCSTTAATCGLNPPQAPILLSAFPIRDA